MHGTKRQKKKGRLNDMKILLNWAKSNKLVVIGSVCLAIMLGIRLAIKPAEKLQTFAFFLLLMISSLAHMKATLKK